jgi:HK97 family phage major capsid protein
VDFIPGLPGNVLIPTLTGRPSLKPTRASVDTAMTKSDPTFGQMSMSPNEAYIYFGVDNRLLQMSALNLGQLAMSLLRDGMIEGICNWLLVADGTATYNSITGILEEATYVTAMTAGHKSFGAVDNADLNKGLIALWKRGRANASFLMSLYVKSILEDVTRTGKITILGQDGLTCKGRPIVIDEGMPDEADDGAGKAIMGVGDLSTYVVGLVGGIQLAMSTERGFDVNQTMFRGVVNMDIKRKPVSTFTLLKTAAA